MKVLSVLVSRIDDHLNPVALKELRQAVHGWFVLGIIFLFLLTQVVLVGYTLIESSRHGGMNLVQSVRMGREVFVVLFGILLGVCMVLVPLVVGIRVGMERIPENMDLLFTTTLAPRSIVWGKFIGGVVLAGLFYSICAPFLLFTYLFRGVDIPSILLLLVLGFMAVTAAIQIAVFFGSVSVHIFWKIALGLVGLAGIVSGYSGLVVLVDDIMRGQSLVDVYRPEFWYVVIGFSALFCSIWALFFSFTVAVVSSPGSNRIVPVRVTFVIILLVTGCMAGFYPDSIVFVTLLTFWLYFVALPLLFLMLVISVCERQQPGRRLLRVVRRYGPGRLFKYLFSSGAGGGIVLTFLLLTVSVLLPCLVSQDIAPFLWGPGSYESLAESELLKPTIGAVLFIVSYSLLPFYIQRRMIRKLPHYLTWTLVLGLLLPGVLLWIAGEAFNSSELCILLPFGPFLSDSVGDISFTIAGFLFVISMVVTIPFLFRSLKEFKPVSQQRSMPVTE